MIHVNVWQNPLQYCKVISLQLIKINGKKKRKAEYNGILKALLFTAESYSIVQIHHIYYLFIIDGQLGCFHLLATGNDAANKRASMNLTGSLFSILWGIRMKFYWDLFQHCVESCVWRGEVGRRL